VGGLDRAQDGVTIFLGVVIEATPFLLLGGDRRRPLIAASAVTPAARPAQPYLY
jgi:hypothetical protein